MRGELRLSAGQVRGLVLETGARRLGEVRVAEALRRVQLMARAAEATGDEPGVVQVRSPR